jgi:membrane protease subunit (stomatin/prohibitin family)
MGIRQEFANLFIAVPDDAKDQILYKWPEDSIRKFSTAIVDVDQQAVFLARGEVKGTLPPGRHSIDAAELPFLGMLIDAATDGNAYRAELYFVGTREYVDERFGGRLDNVSDPLTGILVTLLVHGTYSLKVVDPVKLILNLTGTVDVTDNDAIGDWVDQQLLKVMRTDVTNQIATNQWPVYGLAAYIPQIEASALAAAATQLATYGVEVKRLGNFEINLDDADADRLKEFSEKVAGTRLAGSFREYGAGEVLLGAGEGFAEGGGAAGAGLLAAGFGVGGAAGAGTAGPAAPIAEPVLPPAPAGSVTPPGQSAPAAPPAEAAGPAAAAPVAGSKFCTNCGAALPDDAKFCGNCGTARPTAP